MNIMTQMKQYIVRMVLLCMVMMCGAGSVWGQTNKLVYSTNRTVDDYYLEGGITFDVGSEYTTFTWYCSKTRPATDAALTADASKFMVVETDGEHATTSITWTRACGANPTYTVPTADTNSAYALSRLTTHPNTVTVVGEVVTQNITVNGKSVEGKFYAPEATASGNTWHYLRQLIDHSEAYVDFVWCVASNEGGSQTLTSDVVEITVHPARSQVYALDGYESDDMDGERLDFHLPSIYTGMYFNAKMQGHNVVVYTQYPGEKEVFPEYLLGKLKHEDAKDVEVNLTSDMFKTYDKLGEEAVTPTGNAGCAYVVGSSTDMPYGDGSVRESNFADLKDYKKLKVTVSAGVPRFLLNRDIPGGNDPEHLINIPNNGDQTAKYQTIEDNPDGSKTYVIDLVKIREDWRYSHLHSIKCSGGNVTVTSMALVMTSAASDYYEHAPTVALTYKDASGNIYSMAEDGINYLDPTHKTGKWDGPDVNLRIAELVPRLNETTSAHKLYKEFPETVVPFVFRTDNKVSHPKVNGTGHYHVGPVDETLALTTGVDFYFDYSNDAPTPLGAISEKTVWDWNELRSKQTECFNIDADGHIVTHENQTDAQHSYVIDAGVRRRKTILDADRYIVGPMMGDEYVMSDFYSYSMDELRSAGIDFPADKVQIGLECFNDNVRRCMQGNAFIIKPTVPGVLEVVFSSTNGGEKRNLVLNSRIYNNDGSYKEMTMDRFDDDSNENNQTSTNDVETEKRTIRMNITSSMVGDNKVAVVRAKTWGGKYVKPTEEPGLKNQVTPDVSSLNGMTLVVTDAADTPHMQVLGRSQQNATSIECADFAATDYGRIRFKHITDAAGLPDDVNTNNLYTMQILNKDNQRYEIWGGEGFLNFSPWWSLFALGKENETEHNYGANYDHGGLWEITKDDANGYVIKNVGTKKQSNGTYYYYNPAGNGSTSPVTCYFYESIVADPTRVEDNVENKYFSVYKATFTPNAAKVDFKEWKDNEDRAVGAQNQYSVVYDSKNHYDNYNTLTDGYVSMSVDNEPGATIKYKFYPGTLTEDEYKDPTDAQKAILDTLTTYNYIAEANVDYVLDGEGKVTTDASGNPVILHRIGFHAKKNGTLIAWAEVDGKTPSEPTFWQTHGATYPVDMRFWEYLKDDPDTPDPKNQDGYNTYYWGTTDETDKTPEQIIADRDVTGHGAHKAWHTDVSKFAEVFIDGVRYTKENFLNKEFHITHNSVIELKVVPKEGYVFDGWGAPSVIGSEIKDLMRSEKSKHVIYHLLYDKAKAKTTDFIAFLVGHFAERTSDYTAKVLMKDGTDAETDPSYVIGVDVAKGDTMVAPVYHSAHDFEGKTMAHWTEEHSLRDENNIIRQDAVRDNEQYRDYYPGSDSILYEDILLKPVYRDNIYLDDLKGRLRDATVTWRFDRAGKAQTLTVRNEYPGFTMPYVAPVMRSEVGKVPMPRLDPVKGNLVYDANDTFFDVAMTITPGTLGRLDNSVTRDWCSVGRGVKFTLPACKGAEVSLEVRSPLSSATGGTTFGGEFPKLWKVKYKGEDGYAETSTPDPIKTVESYIYKYTYTGDDETLDIILGNDYSYLRSISIMLPRQVGHIDAPLISTDFADLLTNTTPYDKDDIHSSFSYQRLISSDDTNVGVSRFRTHFSDETSYIFYDKNTVAQFSTLDPLPGSLPYVNGLRGYTYSIGKDGVFVLGPFRDLTHIRFMQGSSENGVGELKYATCKIDDAKLGALTSSSSIGVKANAGDDFESVLNPLKIPDSYWSESKGNASISPEWVTLNMNEHMGADYTGTPGTGIYLRMTAGRPNLYLFAMEAYGECSVYDALADLHTGVLAVPANYGQSDYEEKREESLSAGSIHAFPLSLQLDEESNPIDNDRLRLQEGNEVTLTANALDGYQFKEWIMSTDLENEDFNNTDKWEVVSTENPYTFVMDQSKHIRAVFIHRGSINYSTRGANYGITPERQQALADGTFLVAENRSMYKGEGLSLRQWEDETLDWYDDVNKTADPKVDRFFDVSWRTVNEGYTPSWANMKNPAVPGGAVDGGNPARNPDLKSRAATGSPINVYADFTENNYSLLDVSTRKGVPVRWYFGKSNGAPTMEGHGNTPQLVSQALIKKKTYALNNSGETEDVYHNEMIDVPLKFNQVSVNNAGRADEYAVVSPDATHKAQFTLTATKGMRVVVKTNNNNDEVQIGADDDPNKVLGHASDVLEYRGSDAEVPVYLTPAEGTTDIILDYIQATYYPRIQKPIVSLLTADDSGDGNVRIQVNTSANPTARRYYTKDGSTPDPTKLVGNGGTTYEMVGDFINIQQSEVPENGMQIKVLAVSADRPDSEIAILDLNDYDPALGLATYVYDSRITDIHEDRIFQKLKADHKGHFNLMSYDLNPAAGKIPEIITTHTTVFVTSDAVRDHLMTALTTPSDAAAHGQAFFTPAVEVGGVYKSKPFIIGTPTTIWWNEGYTKDRPANTTAQGYFILDSETHKFIAQNPDNDHPLDLSGTTVYYKLNNTTTTPSSGWQGMTWVSQDDDKKPVVNPATPTSPATITYTEMLRGMKDTPTRVDVDKTYEQYYADQITAAGGKYILAFYDNMLLEENRDAEGNLLDSKVCISNTTDNAPENLSANGTQLVFNATELLTRITDGTPADVSSFNSTLLALMGPTKNPQLIDVKMSYTEEVIDFEHGDETGWIAMDAPMLSALSDGLSVMSMPYLSKTYPQFVASTILDKGKVDVTNVQTWHSDADGDINKVEKLGAQGIKDLATIITVSNKSDEVTAGLDPNFKREYRIEYNIALDSLTFHKVGDKWVNTVNDLWTLEEEDGIYYVTGPQNRGIKDVCFNQTINGGNGEIYKGTDVKSPDAYYAYDDADGWRIAQFPWGFRDCYRMAFSIGNNAYDGDIKIRFYRRQAERPELEKAYFKDAGGKEHAIRDDMEVDPNGEFVLNFNSVMHEVRKPGSYADRDVDWTVHILPEEYYSTDFRKLDETDVEGNHFSLVAEGGSNTLHFQYWHLEEGKKYYLHIPFHILRGAVGEGLSYLPANYNEGGSHANGKVTLDGKEMSYTDYSYPKKDKDGNVVKDAQGNDVLEYIPYFDIPFTVKKTEYNHMAFNYIVNSNKWWEAYRVKGNSGEEVPNYAKWDGDFKTGIDKIKGLEDEKHFYMHVQKNIDAAGKAIPYTYGTGNAGLIELKKGYFSIVGEGSDSTVITACPDAYSGGSYTGLSEKPGENTSTIHLDASDVYMQGITIQNTQTGTNVDGQEYPALFDHGNRNTYYDVNIDAFEETFAIFGNNTYLENCKISGYGDFIVGSGDAWLEKCNIFLRNRPHINLCAPSTKATNKWGIVFNNCIIDREAGASNVTDHNWTLARPWGGYDEAEVLKSPAMTLLNTQLKVLPTNAGYTSLTDGLRLRFHEYKSYQTDKQHLLDLSVRSVTACNGAEDSDVPALRDNEAAEYSIQNVFGRDNDGYDPQALTKQAQAPVLANDGMVLHWKANKEDLCYLVYYLGDGDKPDWQNAMMFCCVPGTDAEQAYCYLTNHDESPIFRTGEPGKTPISFSELWYGKRKVNGSDEAYNDDDIIPGMGKDSPSRLWFAVRAANQMGGLSEMSNALMYHAARQYRTTIKIGGVLKGDDSGNAYSTIYLDFQALAPKGVKAYALTGVSSSAGEGTAATTLTFTRVSESDGENHQDVVYADQGYLIYGPYGKTEGKKEMNHVFIETTTPPDMVLTSHFSGTVGEFNPQGKKDGQPYISEQGYGEMPDESMDGHGWSIAPIDYKDVSKGNINAFTLQKYNELLGFYKFTGKDFSHHRAYLDAEKAADLLMENEGMTKEEAEEHLVKGLRFIIREPDGTETEISSVFMDEDAKDGIYDLEGRRLSSRKQLKPGHIYIIDGQKVMWKR